MKLQTKLQVAAIAIAGISVIATGVLGFESGLTTLKSLAIGKILGLGILIVGAAGILGIFMARRITRPLTDLARLTEEFGAGDLSHRAPPGSADEMGDLTRSFNRMADNLAGEIRERRRAEEQFHGSREQFRNLSAHLETVREEERARIARDIHDDLGQCLTRLKLDVALLKQEAVENGVTDLVRVEGMSQLIDTTIRSVKRIVTELRPRLLDDLGLTAAIEWHVADFQHRTGIPVSLSIYPKEVILDGERSTALFRIVQEALLNTAKHACANGASVSLTDIDGVVELDLRDNGRGITPEQIADNRSFGLMGIRERARILGGTAEILGVPHEGTKLIVRFPSSDEGEVA